MESPYSDEHDSGSTCEGISKSAIPNYLDSDMMERIYACLCDKKITLRNSAKLKSQIHAEINDLIEILRERERQLDLEIDEINLDQCEAVHIVAELCNYASSEKFKTNSPVIEQLASDNPESSKMHSTTFLNSELAFVSNFNDMKNLLQNFGHIKKIEQANDNSEEGVFENGSDDQLTDEQMSEALDPTDFIEKVTGCFMKNKVKRSRNDSSGSVNSFEIIDPSDEEFQQFSEEHKQQDDLKQISNPEVSKTTVPENECVIALDASTVSAEPHQRYKLKTHWMIDSKRLREVLNYKKKKKSKNAKPLWPPADCRILPPLDPTKRLRKQLKEMAVSKKPSHNVQNLEGCGDHGNESTRDVKDQETKIECAIKPQVSSNLDNQSSQVKIESSRCLSRAKPVPSAIIQETFEKFLGVGSPDKWLAPPKKCFQPAVRSDSHLFSAKRLHFQVQ